MMTLGSNKKGKVMKNLLCGLVIFGMISMILTSGCSGGGNSDSSSTNSDVPCGVGVVITSPSYEDTFTTTSSPAILGGITHPDFTNVTWSNSSTGGTGNAVLGDYTCDLFGCAYHWVAYVPLTSGSNQIKIEAYDGAGKLRGRACVTIIF